MTFKKNQLPCEACCYAKVLYRNKHFTLLHLLNRKMQTKEKVLV